MIDDVKITEVLRAKEFAHITAHLSGPMRNRSFPKTDLNGMSAAMKKNGLSITTETLMRFFKVLEGQNVGKLTRLGRVIKFEWVEGYSLYKLGQLIPPETPTLLKRNVQLPNIKESPITESVADMTDHKFFVRPGMQVTIQLPEDFSSREADRLQQFIKTIPFNQEAP